MSAPFRALRLSGRASVLLGFALVQLLVIAFAANGPTGDEGIYAWVGMGEIAEFPRVIAADWMNGSPWLWPWFAGPAFLVGGLAGLRVVALLVALAAMWMATDTVRMYFDESVAFWSAVALVLNGTLFALAHRGVYDLPALAGAAATVWCLARRARGEEGRWLLGATLAAGLSVISKYGYVFLGPVYVGILLASGQRRWRDVFLFCAGASLLVLSHDWFVLGSLFPRSYGAFTAASVPVGRALVAAEQLYCAVPVLLGAIGWQIVRRDTAVSAQIKRTSTVWFGALLVWPLFHLATDTVQAADKHVVSGALLAAPLIGLALSRAPRRRLVVAALAAWGTLQWATLEFSWPNAAPTVAYLVANVRPGERIVSNAGTYRHIAALRAAGTDLGFSELGPAPKEATAEWIVWEDPVDVGQQQWLERAKGAGYREVLHYQTRFVGADDVRPFGLHRVESRVFRRTPDSVPR